MNIKITVSGPNGQSIEHEAPVRQKGDLADELTTALATYHTLYPDAPPFEHSIKVEHA